MQIRRKLRQKRWNLEIDYTAVVWLNLLKMGINLQRYPFLQLYKFLCYIIYNYKLIYCFKCILSEKTRLESYVFVSDISGNLANSTRAKVHLFTCSRTKESSVRIIFSFCWLDNDCQFMSNGLDLYIKDCSRIMSSKLGVGEHRPKDDLGCGIYGGINSYSRAKITPRSKDPALTQTGIIWSFTMS